MRFGVQMYGLNPIFLRDKETFLRRIAAAGYRYAEPCFAFEEVPGMEDRIWLPADFAENWPLLEKYGICINSCHVFTKDLSKDLDRLAAFAKEYKIAQLVLPCPVFGSDEDGMVWAQRLTAAVSFLHSAGVELLLHNDRRDSALRPDGVSSYEWLLRRCEGKVGAQADTGWLLHGGTDPEVFLWRNASIVRSLHYKDMEKTSDGMAEIGVGHGAVDMMACFQFARAAEVIQIVDQDGSRGDFMEDLDFVAGKFRDLSGARDRTRSILCILDTVTGEVKKLHTFDGVIEAPNWMQTDEDSLIFNSDGFVFRYRISEDTATKICTGACSNCNNDHVLSPDEKRLAVSHSDSGWMSRIYTLPVEGGEPTLVTENAPSFLHGWSPDGEELAYCAFRDHGKGYEVDIYVVPAGGGEEKRLTENAGFNDGPEYSPDGQHIWFISTRSGLMQCWRMNRDGSEPRQMTFRERNNWFPHVSPNGEKVVYLSYSRDGLDPSEHLPNMWVELGLMNADGSDDRTILSFFGGQGSINVNSWHKDSRHLAFVMYELEHR